MSGGGGGYYKYRCKNWLSNDCGNWVWVNGSSCSNCLAQGRGIGLGARPQLHQRARQIYVPHLSDGILQYKVMEILVDNLGGAWKLKDRPVAEYPTSRTTLEVTVDEDHNLLSGEE